MTNTDKTALAALSDSLADAVEHIGRQIVSVAARRRSHASGIQWRPGVIVTADHVVERDEDIAVITPDGVRRPATLVGRDPTTDLAVLSVSEIDLGLPQISGPARAGQLVAAVARPGEHGLSVSFGALSSVGGEFRTHGGGKIDQLLRPDVTFYPGFSGSALIDTSGAVLGLNTSGLTRGLPLTIPSSTVSRVLEQLLTSGTVERGYLGLRFQGVELPESISSALKLAQPYGLLVVGVEPDGPSAQAGIIVGDVVVALGGKSVAEPDSVQATLDPETVGTTLAVKLVRGGGETDLSVVVGKRPAGTRYRHGHGPESGHGHGPSDHVPGHSHNRGHGHGHG